MLEAHYSKTKKAASGAGSMSVLFFDVSPGCIVRGKQRRLNAGLLN